MQPFFVLFPLKSHLWFVNPSTLALKHMQFVLMWTLLSAYIPNSRQVQFATLPSNEKYILQLSLLPKLYIFQCPVSLFRYIYLNFQYYIKSTLGISKKNPYVVYSKIPDVFILCSLPTPSTNLWAQGMQDLAVIPHDNAICISIYFGLFVYCFSGVTSHIAFTKDTSWGWFHTQIWNGVRRETCK